MVRGRECARTRQELAGPSRKPKRLPRRSACSSRLIGSLYGAGPSLPLVVMAGPTPLAAKWQHGAKSRKVFSGAPRSGYGMGSCNFVSRTRAPSAARGSVPSGFGSLCAPWNRATHGPGLHLRSRSCAGSRCGGVSRRWLLDASRQNQSLSPPVSTRRRSSRS